MLRIRRSANAPAASCALLAGLLVAAGPATADGPAQSAVRGAGAHEGHEIASAGLTAILRPAVVESIAAWGVSPDDVVGGVRRLGNLDIARVVDEAGRLAWRDWRQSARYQAMYLVLVAEFRESLLHGRVASTLREARSGAVPAQTDQALGGTNPSTLSPPSPKK